jgi:hypothetical protein
LLKKQLAQCTRILCARGPVCVYEMGQIRFGYTETISSSNNRGLCNYLQCWVVEFSKWQFLGVFTNKKRLLDPCLSMRRHVWGWLPPYGFSGNFIWFSLKFVDIPVLVKTEQEWQFICSLRNIYVFVFTVATSCVICGRPADWGWRNSWASYTIDCKRGVSTFERYRQRIGYWDTQKSCSVL